MRLCPDLSSWRWKNWKKIAKERSPRRIRSTARGRRTETSVVLATDRTPQAGNLIRIPTRGRRMVILTGKQADVAGGTPRPPARSLTMGALTRLQGARKRRCRRRRIPASPWRSGKRRRLQKRVATCKARLALRGGDSAAGRRLSPAPAATGMTSKPTRFLLRWRKIMINPSPGLASSTSSDLPSSGPRSRSGLNPRYLLIPASSRHPYSVQDYWFIHPESPNNLISSEEH